MLVAKVEKKNKSMESKSQHSPKQPPGPQQLAAQASPEPQAMPVPKQSLILNYHSEPLGSLKKKKAREQRPSQLKSK